VYFKGTGKHSFKCGILSPVQAPSKGICIAGSSSHEVTHLLHAWSGGDQGALEKLTPLVYAELRRRAQRYMAHEREGHTLQTTALVNEVYLRLVDIKKVTWQDRAHFLAICARLMRQVLTDSARSKGYQKRGGGSPGVDLDEALLVSGEPSADLVALDDSLKALAAFDRRKSQVVELRFFGGLSVDETAEVLKVSRETVLRDWRLAKSWLRRELGGERPGGS
jgi:RNA polymerase sigma-70 factor, ECF subfamily